MMTTDEERHEVARRLRSLDDSELQVYDMTYFAIQRAVGGGVDQYPDGRELADRLADLIEPKTSEQTNPRDSSLSASLCDRDALLAMAKGLDSKADDIIRAAQHARFSKLGPTMGEAKHEACEWRGIARRIREALGVVA